MEEYEYKLNKTNPVLILNTVKNMIDKMKQYEIDKNIKEFDLYYKFLKDKCLYGNNTVSTTIANGFISLSSHDVQDVDNKTSFSETILNDLLSSITHARNLNGVIHIVINILSNKPELNYGIIINQHPLITILKLNQTIWPTLEPRIRINLDNSIFYGSLKPFFLYVLYDYGFQVSENFQLKVLSMLSLKDPATIEIYRRIYLFSKTHINRTLNYLKARPKCHADLMANCIYKLLEYDMDPLDAIFALKEFFLSPYSKQSRYGAVVNILANCIINAPIIYLYELLDLCYHLLKFHVLEAYSLNLLKSSITHWKLKFPVYDELSSKANHTMNAILAFKGRTELEYLDLDFENDDTDFDEYTFEYLSTFDKDVFISMNLQNVDLNKIKPDLLEVPASVLNDIFNFLLSNLFKNNDDGFVLKALLKCIEAYPERSPELLARILYELANTTEPLSISQLLRALPQLGILKENLLIVVSTLKSLSNTSTVMNTLVMSIYYDLWAIDARCYPYLQEMFLQDKNDDNDFCITKAYILRDLCEKKPELYGAELTTHLSKILNDSTNDGLAASFALQGITHLCKNDIIDFITAWGSLAPKFEQESRSIVIKALCEMIAEVPNMCIQSDEKREEIHSEIINKLWNYTITSSDLIVLSAAYKALGTFKLEQISVHIPDIYKSGNYENPFGYISGDCFMNVLLIGNRFGLNCAGDMLIELVAAELKGYRNINYQIHEGSGEPMHMETLQKYSIVRALSHYIKTNVGNCHKDPKYPNFEVYLQCLRVLSKQYSKPLPPMDWCFLQEILYIPEAQEFAITIASRQVALSGTARRLLENLFLAYAEKPSEVNLILYMYKNLKNLCNSIQPILMGPFIKNTLNYMYENLNTDPLATEENIKIMTDNLIAVLTEKTILEANKSVISEAIVSLFIKDNKSCCLMDCVEVLPIKYLDIVSIPKQCNELNIKEAKMCIEIRSQAAFNAKEGDPFTYLNALTELTCFQQNEDLFSVKSSRLYLHLFEHLKKVFSKHRENEFCVSWLMELMGKIQMDLADNRKMDRVEVKCFIFMIAVSVLSGYYLFEETHNFYSFPQALPHLLKNQRFRPFTTQILEWLYDIGNNKRYKISRQHQNDIKKIFINTLIALRHETQFNDNFKWMKYIE